MEKAVTFNNGAGLPLVGIYHIPDTDQKKTGILFVHSGIQGRLGTTNQYVYYAREFVRRGYPCLRFDPNGLGDSGGVVEDTDRRDYYGTIQTGRYVADVGAAIDDFLRNGVDHIVIFGLCGGAITSLLAASSMSAVSGAVLLSCPVVLDGANVDYNLRIPAPIARRELGIYIRKLFSISSWLKFLTLKTDYKRLYLRLKAALSFDAPSQVKGGNADTTGLRAPKPNSCFYDAYEKCKAKNKLWIYGLNDQFWFEFKKLAYDIMNLDTHDELYLVPNGNHMFTLPEWQRIICDQTLEWLERKDYR